MWIRSQDKQILGNFNCIKIQRNLRKYAICANDSSETCVLGEYDNLNNALSILDTIQDLLKTETTILFQMPN